jgi:hypothetical protein
MGIRVLEPLLVDRRRAAHLRCSAAVDGKQDCAGAERYKPHISLHIAPDS